MIKSLPPTVAFDEEKRELVIIDQTLLPNACRLLRIGALQEIFDAIARLAVRGAPAIGVAAAIGLYLEAERIQETDYVPFSARIHEAKEYLASSRPTAVNLFWALDRMEAVVRDHSSCPVTQIKKRMRDEVNNILDEDVAVCRKLGEYGLTLVADGASILTHCNAGQLATVRYGTALSPMYIGAEKGMHFKVFCDETRPLLQGARLSAYEMTALGMDTTVLCDNMAASLMQSKKIDAVFVGCDRVAANGDAANKIGTLGLAILAKHFGVPFYVFAPSSTIDMQCKCGADIVIENRNAEEVSTLWYQQKMTPDGAGVYNPAFDVTPVDLITALITEHGIKWLGGTVPLEHKRTT